MHQLVKLTDAIWVLQLAISPLIHALGDSSQAPTGIWTQVARWLTTWAICPPKWYNIMLKKETF